jgi:hypothetical protein
MTDKDIKTLLEAKNETPNLDYKETLVWDREHRDERLEVLKDILAMANTQDGGKIVFGVRDGDFEFVGLSDEAYDSFDTTPVNQFLHNYADPAFTCSIVKQEIEGKKVVVIDIPEFSEIPIICKQSANSSSNTEVLKKGAVYIRTKDCSSEPISTADKMRSILAIGLTRKKEELLGLIQKLITGKPLQETDEDKQLYEKEIANARDFFESNLTSDVGFWELTAYPTTYKADLIQNPVEAGNIVEQSVVRLRGWDLPHVDRHGNESNFNEGKQSFTVSDRVQTQEAWRMHRSGLFVWKDYFKEDLRGYESEDGRKLLFFVSAIYSLTEIMLFLKRIYAEKLEVDTIHVELVLSGCKGRMLGEGQPGLLHRGYICNEERITIKRDIKTVDLLASFETIAREFVKEIFMLFNWNDPAEHMLEDWQKKLLEHGG